MNAPSSDTCPVCGYDLGFVPWSENVPADEICPSCGIQFGYDDAAGGRPEARRDLYDRWREKWICDGMQWASVGRNPPVGWDPQQQLKGHLAADMTGHSKAEQALNKVLWADADIERITVDYDVLSILLNESTSIKRTIRALGYIGYRMIGVWDEMIVEKAELLKNHPFIDECVDSMKRRLGTDWIETGSPSRNTRGWSALIVHLLDGCTLEVVAAAFEESE